MTPEKECQAREEAAQEAACAEQAATDACSVNEALDATPNALIKRDLLECTITKCLRDNPKNLPPHSPNHGFSFAKRLLQPVNFNGNDCEGITYYWDVYPSMRERIIKIGEFVPIQNITNSNCPPGQLLQNIEMNEPGYAPRNIPPDSM